MAEETQQITYTYEGKSYDAHKFTDEGKLALESVARLNNTITLATKQLNDAQAASLFYKQSINNQLTDEMLVDEALQEDLPLESASKEI